ncbi:hypothetical protein [Leptobacterium sp. I13]|uniref:hypothetical protein n=1 Tax=Leptobacterium meishanense TaxID=3128904 RepID=UPI0030ECAE0F
MNKRNIWFFSCLIVTFSTILLLATGSFLLTVAIDNSNTVPLGSFIIWAGIISFPHTIYWGVKELRRPTKKFNKILAVFLKIIITLAILWLPLAYLLAGNLSFSFSEKESFQGGQNAMKWFWRLSYGIEIGALLIIVIYCASLLFIKKKATVNNL